MTQPASNSATAEIGIATLLLFALVAVHDSARCRLEAPPRPRPRPRPLSCLL